MHGVLGKGALACGAAAAAVLAYGALGPAPYKAPLPGRRCVFITGAASGIGLATAKAFAAAGWFVGIFDIAPAAALQAAAKVHSLQCVADSFSAPLLSASRVLGRYLHQQRCIYHWRYLIPEPRCVLISACCFFSLPDSVSLPQIGMLQACRDQPYVAGCVHGRCDVADPASVAAAVAQFVAATSGRFDCTFKTYP